MYIGDRAATLVVRIENCARQEQRKIILQNSINKSKQQQIPVCLVLKTALILGFPSKRSRMQTEILDDASAISEITMSTMLSKYSQPPLNAHITTVDCIPPSLLASKNDTEKSPYKLESDGYNLINMTHTRVSLHKARDNFDYFRKLREEAEGDHDSETMNSRERDQRRGRKHQSSQQKIRVTEAKVQNNPRDTVVRRDALHIRDRLQVKSRLEGPIKDPVLRPRSIAAPNRSLQGSTSSDVKGEIVVGEVRVSPYKAGIRTKNAAVDSGKENSNIACLKLLSSSQEYSKCFPLRSDKIDNANTTQSGDPHSVPHSVVKNGVNNRNQNLNGLAVEPEKYGFSNSPTTIMATKTLEGKEFQAGAQWTTLADTHSRINRILQETRNMDMLDKTTMNTNQPLKSGSTVVKVGNRL